MRSTVPFHVPSDRVPVEVSPSLVSSARVLDRYIDVADLIPCLPAHHAVGGQIELLLERPYRGGHPAAEYAVHRQFAKEGIVLGDAVQLPLQGEYRRAAGCPAAAACRGSSAG